MIYKVCKQCKKRARETKYLYLEKYISRLIERVLMRDHAMVVKGLDRLSKEALSAAYDEIPKIPDGYEVKVRFIPKVTVSKKKNI